MTVTVNQVNDPGTFTGDTAALGPEDTVISGTVTLADSDGATTPGYSVSVGASNGVAAIDPVTGEWTYTPVSDFNGSDSFTVSATDDDGNVETQVISVTVSAVADVVADSLTTAEDTPVTANVITGTNGASADNFESAGRAITAVTQGANGSVTFLAGGDVTYTPNADFNGTDTFTYTVSSGGVIEQATVTVVVGAVDDAASFGGDTTGTGTEDTPVTGVLTVTDSADGMTAPGFTVTGAASNGTATIDPGTGAWTYTPNADYFGADAFTVTVTDDDGNTATQVISLTVTPEQDAFADAVSTDEDTAVTASVTANDAFEGTPVFLVNDDAANGTVTDNGSGSYTYTPDANFNGTDTFTYTVTSGGVVETATVTVTVNQVNDPATIGGDLTGSGAEDGGDITGTLTASDTADGMTTPGFTVTGAAGNGTATIDSVTGAWSYTPDADYNGTDSFTVTVTDDDGNTETQVINLTVSAEQDAFDDTVSTNEDTAVTASVTGNDVFEGAPVFSVNDDAANGTVTDNGSGSYTYTPDANFNGTDTFTYTVTSGGVVETATVTVTVNPIDDPVTFSGDISGTGAEDAAAITGSLGVTDAADGMTSPGFTVSTGAANGTASINASGDWSYTPNADYFGTDSFTVTVTDDDGNTATQVVSLTVGAVTDIIDDSLSTLENTAVTANVLTGTNGATADNFEGTEAVTAVTQGTNGTVTFLANGEITYTPDVGFNGTDTFTYTVLSGGVTETGTVSVNIGQVNDPATFGGDTSGTGTEDGVDITGTLTVTDATDGMTTPNFTVVGAATNGTAAINPVSGAWTYTPVADFNGSDSFTVRVTDDSGNNETQVINVTVAPEIDVTADALTTTEDTAITANVLTGTNGATADGFEGTPLVTAVTQGANGSVTFLAGGDVT